MATTKTPQPKRIGLLTSGGDCGGLNAVIRGVVGRATMLGWEVVGIASGIHGLLDRPPAATPVDPSMFTGNILRQGGTILGTTNRGDPFAFPMPDGTVSDRSQEVIDAYHELGLEALIGIGGDGSMAILRRLALQGDLPLIGIPKTIDNDVGVTEFSVGFATAVDVATQALDMLQPTAASHSRVMILEVMGRDAGHIAIAAGIAGGADIVLIPEIDYKLDAVAAKIDRIRQGGRNFALCVVAEAVKGENGSPVTRIAAEGNTNYGGIGGDLADRIAQATGAETRVTVLGHVQRGAPPSPQDRIIGQAFGVAAVDAVDAGKSDRIVIWQNRNIMDISIADAIAAPGRVDLDGIMVRTARGLDICLGDR
ncbi:MAG: ATP-dependent 6-phosphofructokinase [Alphaproteobacteria bacterium]|nr:ATP-dependent 6-phosphofructokinase [Alphaproteobacteria bacterium]MCZ6765152.1 ATP-dependent 6-phosphofructokinase [Alphaproteobacteria bacterium]